MPAGVGADDVAQDVDVGAGLVEEDAVLHVARMTLPAPVAPPPMVLLVSGCWLAPVSMPFGRCPAP